MPDAVRFEVLGRVRSGASGTVWKAHDTGLDRVVALKEITGQSAAEAQALASVRSPHVVQVFGVVEDGGRVYLVEEWVDGATLGEVLTAAGRLSTDQALGVIRGALQGLADAHRAGLVHGDVSSSNILVDGAGTSKMIDFGSVVRSGERARSSTGAYAAPEVLAGDVATPASDVYAAAAVLATLMHGRRDIRPSTRGIAGEIRPVLDRALDGNPLGRYRDAGEFLAALEEAARRRYGAAWFTEAGLGALATAATAGLVTTGLAAVPFAAGGATIAGAGTSVAPALPDPFAAPDPFASNVAARSADPFGTRDPFATRDLSGPRDPFRSDVAAAVARRRRLGLMTGGGALVAAAAAIIVIVATSGDDTKPAALHQTPIATSAPPPISTPTSTPTPTPTPTPTGAPTHGASPTRLDTPTSVAPTVSVPAQLPLDHATATISYQALSKCDACPALTPSGSQTITHTEPHTNILGRGVLSGLVTDGQEVGNSFQINGALGVGSYHLVAEEPDQPGTLSIGLRVPYEDPAVNKSSGGGAFVRGGVGQEAPSAGCDVDITAADSSGFRGTASCPRLEIAEGQYLVSLSATFDFTP